MPMRKPEPGSPEAQFIIRRFCQELLWEESAEIRAASQQLRDTSRQLRAEGWLRRQVKRINVEEREAGEHPQRKATGA